MALARRNNSNRGVVGLDIDGAFLAAVQTSSTGISRAASMELPPGVITDGEVTDVAALSDALRDFFRANNLPRRVRLGVSNQQIVVRQLELPKIDDAQELAAAVGSIGVCTRPLSTVWDSDDDSAAAQLAEEIRLSVDFYMAQPDARWVGEVVMSGPGARRPGLAEELGGMIDVPVTVAEPLGRVADDVPS